MAFSYDYTIVVLDLFTRIDSIVGLYKDIEDMVCVCVCVFVSVEKYC